MNLKYLAGETACVMVVKDHGVQGDKMERSDFTK